MTVARAVVRSARSVRLCTDVELLSGRRRSSGPGGPGGTGSPGAADQACEPLLVVGNGRAYTVNDPEPRSAIMGVICKAQQERKARQNKHGKCTACYTPRARDFTGYHAENSPTWPD